MLIDVDVDFFSFGDLHFLNDEIRKKDVKSSTKSIISSEVAIRIVKIDLKGQSM
jgi:hypothetical protein